MGVEVGVGAGEWRGAETRAGLSWSESLLSEVMDENP
jgi:hypothetical protein